MASLTPAQIVHQDDRIGSLAPGKFADLLIIDEQIRVQATYIGGRLVEWT